MDAAGNDMYNLGNIPFRMANVHSKPQNGIFGRVTLAGHLRNSKGVSFVSMRVLGSFALVYVLEGGGRYQLSGQKPHPCQKGDLLVIFPDIAHAYGPDPGGRWDEVYIVFEGEIFDLWRRYGILSPDRPILRLPELSRHARRLKEIASLSRGSDPSRQLDQICKLQSFLASALAAQTGSTGNTGFRTWPDWVISAVQQMESNISAPVETIARAAGLSYESFRKKFRTITGDSPSHYRTRIAVDQARKLIYEQRLTNKELAEKLGFCDEFHFSRRFQQITGQRPKEFRRSLLQR